MPPITVLDTIEHDAEQVFGELKVAFTAESGGTKPGVQTSEFWVTVLTHVSWVLALVFHADLAPYVPAAAMAFAAIATAAYAISRAGLKKPVSLAAALADAKAIEPLVTSTVEEARSVLADLKAAKTTAAK